MDNTHFNPVTHGYVERPPDWPFSSFRRCVAKALYPADWLGAGGGKPAEAGERRCFSWADDPSGACHSVRAGGGGVIRYCPAAPVAGCAAPGLRG